MALGIEIEDRPFAKSTLQVFRAQLILHDKVREVFEQSLRLAREKGYLKGKRGMRVAMDTTYILGRGAVKDTYNLLADGIMKLMRALAAVDDVPVRRWAEAHGYKRYVGSSVKGESAIDWSNRRARRRLLGQIVADADRLLELARQAQDGLPGNAADNLGALELVEQSEASADVPVVEAMGDTAYGDGGTRQAFADAGRKLVARVPGLPNSKHFPKEDFVIHLTQGSCTCPAGQITRAMAPAGKRTDSTGTVHRLQAFRFEGAVCQGCLLRSRCFAAKAMKGRQVLIHPQEALLQEARAWQQSADYDQYRQRGVVAEHRLARLEQLGIRQARYFGRVKTKFQLYLAATVANLTLLANQTGVVGDADDNRDGVVTTAEIGGNHGVHRHWLPTWTLAWLRSPTLALSLCLTRVFRPAF